MTVGVWGPFLSGLFIRRTCSPAAGRPASQRRFGSCPEKTGVVTIRGAFGLLQSEAAFCVQGTLPEQSCRRLGPAPSAPPASSLPSSREMAGVP